MAVEGTNHRYPFVFDEEHRIIDDPNSPEMVIFGKGGITSEEEFLRGLEGILGESLALVSEEDLKAKIDSGELSFAEVFLLRLVIQYYPYFRQRLLDEEPIFVFPSGSKTR